MAKVKQMQAEARREDAARGQKTVKVMKAAKKAVKPRKIAPERAETKKNLDPARCRRPGSIKHQRDYR